VRVCFHHAAMLACRIIVEMAEVNVDNPGHADIESLIFDFRSQAVEQLARSGSLRSPPSAPW
jgi:hypothetical protein